MFCSILCKTECYVGFFPFIICIIWVVSSKKKRNCNRRISRPFSIQGISLEGGNLFAEEKEWKKERLEIGNGAIIGKWWDLYPHRRRLHEKLGNELRVKKTSNPVFNSGSRPVFHSRYIFLVRCKVFKKFVGFLRKQIIGMFCYYEFLAAAFAKQAFKHICTCTNETPAFNTVNHLLYAINCKLLWSNW